MSIGHGGQVLLSGTTRELSEGNLPDGASLVDLGLRRLKDLTQPEQVWQLTVRGQPAEFPPLNSLDARPNNLPVQVSSLIGRERDLDDVKILLGKRRLVTITGSGGVGKTRLALQVGADLIDHYPDGVWFADLAPITDPELVGSVVASAVGMSQVEGRRVDEAIPLWLKRKQLLLIMDNCEHLLDTIAPLADAIHRTAANVRILATSRQALGIAGEAAHRLPSLAVPERDSARSAEDALKYGAVEVFVERAQLADTRFALTDENAQIVAEICRHLDGIPLAIELAAARVKVLSIPNLARRLDERFKVLTGGNRTALPRQQTLSALIDWSYNLLSQQEQTLFNRAGIFAGGFNLGAAGAVCSGNGLHELDILDLLSSLTDKSLAVADTTGTHERYRLLESTRAYALKKLATAGEHDRLARRHGEYFRDQAQAADVRYGMGSTAAWLAGMELELDNYRAALGWAIGQRKDPLLGATLAGALGDFWFFDGLNAEGRRWVQAAFGALGEDVPDDVAAGLWFALYIVSDGRRAYDAAQRAFDLYERVGDRRGMVTALHSIGVSLYQIGHLEASEAALRRSILLASEVGDRRGSAHSTNALAYVLGQRGDVDGARHYYKDALAAHATLGDDGGRAVALRNLAEFEFAQGNVVGAVAHGSEALAIEVRGKNVLHQTWCYANLAAYHVALDQLDGARSNARQALLLAQQMQREFLIAIAIQHLALIGALTDDSYRAARLLGYANKGYRDEGGEREPTEKWSYFKLMERLRGQLKSDELEALLDEGAKLSEEEAVEEALKV
jgi:predicted ATPase